MPYLRAASSLCEVGGERVGLRFIPFDKLRDQIGMRESIPFGMFWDQIGMCKSIPFGMLRDQVGILKSLFVIEQRKYTWLYGRIIDGRIYGQFGARVLRFISICPLSQ